ncbi:MAG TPA: acylphosphatase [Rubrivivax sp.]|nr:acylphosphatase [Rubrivivax sp.]
MEPTVLRLEIRGRVQGVGFRASLADEARRLGLRGWVRNRRDGSVEAMIAGPDEAVQQLLQWSRRGPPAARVDNMQSFAASGRFDTFELWPSC